jgi:membrane protease YdiL (CAAX protease family)
LLTLAAYVLTLILQLGLSMVYYFVARKTLDSTPQNIESFKANFSIFYLLFILINPFFEEIIARAYVMSEVKDLFGKTSLAIIVSVGLQTSYHLYQGWSSAIILFSGFLIFSLYYAESRRVMPVILAHFYFDLLAFLTYVKNLN